MYISEIVKQNKKTISFEIFPPKESTQYELILKAIDELASLKPNFISVTYGAGGGTSKNTVNIASHIQNQLDITALAHLTCVSSSKEEIATILQELKNHHVENILALRGDLPKEIAHTKNHYQYASDLIKDIREDGSFCVGGACYPEGHIDCKDGEQDMDYLKMKVESGCDFLISQLYFDNGIFYNFIDKLIKRNINIPVIAGLMPIQNEKQIGKMCELSGATITAPVKQMLGKYSGSPEDLAKAGIDFVTNQINDLFANGFHSIHIYTMNKPTVAKEILKNSVLSK